MELGPTRQLPITDQDRLSAALRRLGQRDRLVLELRYGLTGERVHSLSEAGKQLGVSPERIRQIETRALTRLGRFA